MQLLQQNVNRYPKQGRRKLRKSGKAIVAVLIKSGKAHPESSTSSSNRSKTVYKKSGKAMALPAAPLPMAMPKDSHSFDITKTGRIFWASPLHIRGYNLG